MSQGFSSGNSYPPPPNNYPPGAYPQPPHSYNQGSYPSYPSNNIQPAVASAPPAYAQVTPMYSEAPPRNTTVPAGNAKGYYWIYWSNHRMAPPSAVRGGTDRDGCAIYVGRAYHEGDWIPAKVIPDRHVAYVPYAGTEHSKSSFQVLCEQRFDWIHCTSGNIPPGAVEGGHTCNGESLYVGRVWHDGAHTVGKVHPSHNCCYIPYAGLELSFSNYEILVLRA